MKPPQTLFSTDISEVSSSLTSLSTWRMVVSASTSRSRGLLLGCLPVSPSTLAVTRASENVVGDQTTCVVNTSTSNFMCFFGVTTLRCQGRVRRLQLNPLIFSVPFSFFFFLYFSGVPPAVPSWGEPCAYIKLFFHPVGFVMTMDYCINDTLPLYIRFCWEYRKQ